MILEQYLLILSMINIIIISVLVYNKKYGWAWALALLQTLILIGNK